jgi:uncharacterized BrkB/YihY/UPF0761 family membrane protein
MQQLSSLEQALAGVFKDLPHLPKVVRDWLVENAWWLVIIGVVLGAIGVLGLLPTLLVGSVVVGYYAGAVAGGSVMVSGIVSIAVLVLTIVIEAMAIQPLKQKKKRGWDLLFLAALISIAGSLVGAVIGGNVVGGIVGTLIGAAIGGYILFELRDHYLAVKKPKEVADKA